MANRISIEVNYMLSKRINLLQLTIDCSAFFLFFTNQYATPIATVAHSEI